MTIWFTSDLHLGHDYAEIIGGNIQRELIKVVKALKAAGVEVE